MISRPYFLRDLRIQLVFFSIYTKIRLIFIICSFILMNIIFYLIIGSNCYFSKDFKGFVSLDLDFHSDQRLRKL